MIFGIMRIYGDDTNEGEYHIGVQIYKCLGNAYKNVKITLIVILEFRILGSLYEGKNS